MNSLIYLFRFIYRIRWWLLIGPALAALFVIYKTQKMSHTYQTRTTIYTGAVSGYSIDPDDSGKQDWASTNNTMDNLVNIIVSQSTLRNVSLRLFAQAMMYGSPDKNTNYISAANYRTLMRHVPKEVVALIDKNSEENTLANLEDYEKASPDNYVYGLFHYTHRHYSYQALSKIVIKRLGNSDMIQVSYESDDPGIAYNTLVLLNEEFVKQYKDLRFGETNNVIKYFEQELERTRKVLTEAEDSLRDYNVEKRVINYDEQTKHVAVLSRDFELRYEDTRIELANTQRLMEVMDDRIDEHVKQLRNNTLFVDKLRTISNLTARITTLESFQNDTLAQALDQPLTARPAGSSTTSISSLKQQLAKAQGELTELTHALGTQYYTKEGLSTSTLVDQWLDVLIRNEKAKAEMKVLQEWKDRLDDRYVFYAPVGTTIKRKQREINFTEQSYLSILHGLNMARLKQKSLQITSATLKVINPPSFPIAAMPTKRKVMVLAAFFGTMIFILGYFILLELLDRTLRDRVRTERITGGRVLGAFPAPGKFRFRSYTKACRQVASQYLGNAVLNYFKPGKPNVINLLSTDTGTGKSFLGEQLKTYFKEIGLNVRLVTYHQDFTVERKNYLLAQSHKDFIPVWDRKPDGEPETGREDVIIIEHPSLSTCTVSKALLQEASVNIVVARANQVWKDTDQILFDKVREQAGETPVMLYLNMARREVVESFTGMLPPYTPLRKRLFRFYQFGLTSSGK